MVKLYCKNCGYKFESKMIPIKCPYCSRNKTIIEQQNADELLEELGEIDRSQQESQ